MEWETEDLEAVVKFIGGKFYNKDIDDGYFLLKTPYYGCVEMYFIDDAVTLELKFDEIKSANKFMRDIRRAGNVEAEQVYPYNFVDLRLI